MKKILSIILALCMLLSIAAFVTSCGTEKADTEDTTEAPKKDYTAKEIADTALAAFSFEGKISSSIAKADDPDELIKWTYGLCETDLSAKVTDYFITLPSDYTNTLAVIKFDGTMTDEEYEEVKTVITEQYIYARQSALQMYMPDEYADMCWAIDNPSAIWRIYDNTLVLAIAGSEEPTAIWNAIDAILK